MTKYKRLFSELGPGSVSDSQISGISSADYTQYSISFKGESSLYLMEDKNIIKKIKKLLGNGQKKLTMDLDSFGEFQTKIGNKTFKINCGDTIEFFRTDKDISDLVGLSRDESIELFSAIKACIQVSNIFKDRFGNLNLDEVYDEKDFIKEMKKVLPNQTYEFAAIEGESSIVNGIEYSYFNDKLYVNKGSYKVYSYSNRSKKFSLDAISDAVYKKSQFKMVDSIKQMKDKDKYYVLGEDNYERLVNDLKEIQNQIKKGSRVSSIREKLYLNILNKLGYKVNKDRTSGVFKVTVPAQEINESRRKFLNEYLKLQ